MLHPLFPSHQRGTARCSNSPRPPGRNRALPEVGKVVGLSCDWPWQKLFRGIIRRPVPSLLPPQVFHMLLTAPGPPWALLQPLAAAASALGQHLVRLTNIVLGRTWASLAFASVPYSAPCQAQRLLLQGFETAARHASLGPLNSLWPGPALALLQSLLQPLASALACPKPASLGFRNCCGGGGPETLASALASPKTASIRVSKLLLGPAEDSHCSWPHLGQLWLYFSPSFSPLPAPWQAQRLLL